MRSHLVCALAAVALVTALPSRAHAQGRSRTLVALLAHADDEVAAAPVLARYAREGVEVHLIIASDGSAGSGSRGGYLVRPDSGPGGGAALATARVDEARCAAAALRARQPIHLGFPDGKLGDYVGNRGLLYELTGRVAKEIERLRPDVVITWGPDGGTGHPDHRLVSTIATQLARAGAPGMPERLFYMYLPVEAFRLLNPQRGEPPMLIPQARYFTVHVPFEPADLDAAKRSMPCHRSQFAPEVVGRVLPEMQRVWNGKVSFIPLFPVASTADLFG